MVYGEGVSCCLEGEVTGDDGWMCVISRLGSGLSCLSDP